MEASSTEKKRRATRADVARLAGVSTAVVSYVFNNGPRPVAADTAQQVREAAEKLHYRPNSVARALSTGSSKTLGIVVPDLSNPFFSGVYSALEPPRRAMATRPCSWHLIRIPKRRWTASPS